MDVQLPDGTMLKDIPDGTTKSQIATKLKSSGHAVPDDWLTPAAPKNPNKVHDLVADADIAASAITGGVASLAGGIVKAGGYVNQALGIEKGDASKAAAKLEDALTWEPKTEKGKAVMADVAKGLQAFETWTDKQGAQAAQAIAAAGTKAAEVAKSMGAPQSVVDFIDRHKDQVAAAYGSATKTGLNAAPLALGGELSKIAKIPGKPGEAVGEVPAAPAAAPAAPVAPVAAAPADLSLAPTPPRPAPVAAPAPAAADLSLAPSAPRPAPAVSPAPAAAPLEVAPTSPRGTPSTIGEGPLPATASATASATARAQAYVRDRLGLSWDVLGEATRKKLETVAADAHALDRLNPEAVKRQAKLEALRVPIKTTAGKLNRDEPQLLKEQGAAGTDAGKSIRDTDIAANRDLRKNVEVLIDRLRGVGKSRATAGTREGVGDVVAGRSKESPGVLTKLQSQAKARTKAAYEEARKTDPDTKVPPDPMYEFVRGEPDVINPTTQHVGWLRNWLKRAGIEKVDEAGNVVGDKRPISAIELDDLRKLAGEKTGGTGDSAHYAKKVLTAIDQMFDEGLPESAGKWKAARQAHQAERGEFKNQGAIDRLVGTKGGNFGTDPKTALEDVWKTSVKNAKLEEIRQVKRSLLSGKDAATRLEGKKALRELRAETARDMLREITKGVSTNEAQETNITAESINRWINSMGGEEKLNVIWGRKATRELMDIREAAQITKTEPTVRNKGSNTFTKILNWIDDTGMGDTIKGVAGGPVKLAEKLWNAGENSRIAREAEKDATYAGEKAGQAARLREGEGLLRQRQEAERKRPRPPTYGDRE